MRRFEAYEMLKTGRNVFLTGPAGSGKTFLLNRYIEYLLKHKVNVGVTAPTGIAATHLNGRTIHSWIGMGIHETLNDAQLKRVLEKEQLWPRVHYASVLVIDEISMLNAKRLDLVDLICKSIRQDLRPFGGLQIVFCGDFFQLPPVPRDGQDPRFAVESAAWQNADVAVCYLEEQYRQADERFLRVLNDIRENRVSDETRDILRERLHQPVAGIVRPTLLYTHNSDVDAYNLTQLDKLPGEEKVFTMRAIGIPHLVEELQRGCLAHQELPLKVGAVVMFIRNNFNRGYVNGTIGTVTGFDEDDGFPMVTTLSGEEIKAQTETWAIEDDGKVLASIIQIPLRLAWAITVHKSQGMSLDCAEIDLGKTFEYGMGYVALSRVRTLAGIKLVGLNDLALQVNEQVIVLDKKLREQSAQDAAFLREVGLLERKKVQREFLAQCRHPSALL
ncbi:MAG: ATPase AAA [Parcubacteria group bacterium Gr01-1014_31]|nr:MAG: ATPase AAA [Parcubacteria group bacterium Gr01-1014_31]